MAGIVGKIGEVLHMSGGGEEHKDGKKVDTKHQSSEIDSQEKKHGGGGNLENIKKKIPHAFGVGSTEDHGEKEGDGKKKDKKKKNKKGDDSKKEENESSGSSSDSD